MNVDLPQCCALKAPSLHLIQVTQLYYFEDLGCISVKVPTDLKELYDVETTLSSLILRNERLRPAERLRELLLRNACLLAMLDQ